LLTKTHKIGTSEELKPETLSRNRKSTTSRWSRFKSTRTRKMAINLLRDHTGNKETYKCSKV